MNLDPEWHKKQVATHHIMNVSWHLVKVLINAPHEKGVFMRENVVN